MNFFRNSILMPQKIFRKWGRFPVSILGCALVVAATWGCSDSGSSDVGPTAGGVTDIGNSIASGVVLDVAGTPVKGARVVAYFDSWTQSSVKDSVETLSDDQGKYELQVDSSASYVLYASAGEDCGLAFASDIPADNSDSIVIGPRKMYSGHIVGRNTGSVRIVGSNVTTSLDGDGYFMFYDMPPGEITIAYTDSSTSSNQDSVSSEPLQSRIQFAVFDDKEIFVLPELELWADDETWLVVDNAKYYAEDGYAGIRIQSPASNQWSIPEMDILLSMDGTESVYDNDSTKAENVEYVKGVAGNAIRLKPGQFIDMNSLDICEGDFTVSLWTKWDGPNGEHQILLSERAYWSDSTSRFQWHYEVNSGSFTVMKSMPEYPEMIFFGDSSVVPVGQWTQLVLVSQDGVLSMYVDGEQMGESQEFQPNVLDRKVPLRIGGNEIATETWNGILDEVRIVNTARSAEWIRNDFRKQKRLLQ